MVKSKDKNVPEMLVKRQFHLAFKFFPNITRLKLRQLWRNCKLFQGNVGAIPFLGGL